MSSTIRLDSDPVTDAFLEKPLVVSPETPVREVFGILASRRVGAVLIADQSGLHGVFTERDALKRMATQASLDVPITEAMVRPVVSVPRGETVGVAIRTMSAGGYRRLPVVDTRGIPAGIVSVAGVLHYLVEHMPRMVYNLPPRPHHRTQEKEGA